MHKTAGDICRTLNSVQRTETEVYGSAVGLSVVSRKIFGKRCKVTCAGCDVLVSETYARGG